MNEFIQKHTLGLVTLIGALGIAAPFLGAALLIMNYYVLGTVLLTFGVLLNAMVTVALRKILEAPAGLMKQLETSGDINDQLAKLAEDLVPGFQQIMEQMKDHGTAER